MPNVISVRVTLYTHSESILCSFIFQTIFCYRVCKWRGPNVSYAASEETARRACQVCGFSLGWGQFMPTVTGSNRTKACPLNCRGGEIRPIMLASYACLWFSPRRVSWVGMEKINRERGWVQICRSDSLNEEQLLHRWCRYLASKFGVIIKFRKRSQFCNIWCTVP